MNDAPLPTPDPIQEERRKERAIGRIVILAFDGAKSNWKYLLIALMFLFNSPYAKQALENVTGWKLSGQLQAAAPTLPVPTPENPIPKNRMDRFEKRLDKLQDKVDKIAKALEVE